MRVFSVAVVIMSCAWVAAGCKDDGTNVSDGGVKGDQGTITDGVVSPDGPELCVDLPESFDADYTVKKGCYYAKKTPRIADDVRLTIEPGVKIIFSLDVGLTLGETQVLVARGTQAEPILFTAALEQRGFWKGVRFEATQSDDNRMDWVTVEYGGSTKADADAAGIKLAADSRGVHASLTHCTVRESKGWGLWLGGSAVVPEFSGNTFAQNTKGPASVDSLVVPVLDAGSSFKDNDRAQVVVRAQYINEAATWQLLDAPYYLESAGGLAVKADWTIEPGVTLIAAQKIWIDISGDEAALIARGTADKPITFTGEKQERGFWTGIKLSGSNNTRNALDHVKVEHAGRTESDKDGAGVMLIADSHGVQLAMTNTTLTENQGFGLFASGSAILPSFSGNTLTKNGFGPVSIGALAAHQLVPASDYTGNDVDRVRVRDNNVSPGVTWLDLGVPYVIGGIHIDKPWTIAPGVVLLFDIGGYLEVAGDDAILTAVGTAAKPITFSSADATPGAGIWEAIVFDNTRDNANTFDHCTIELGGGGMTKGWGGMIVAQSDSRGVAVSISNSTIRKSAQYGIWAGLYATVSTSNVTFEDNVAGDLYQGQ